MPMANLTVRNKFTVTAVGALAPVWLYRRFGSTVGPVHVQNLVFLNRLRELLLVTEFHAPGLFIMLNFVIARAKRGN